MKDKLLKITVGDNSHMWRRRPCFNTTRPTLLQDMEVGTEVMVRFKDDRGFTKYRRYRLDDKFFRDEYDAKRCSYTGTFSRVEGGEA